MHTRRLLPTMVAVALLVLVPAPGATGLQTLLPPLDGGADRPAASNPAEQAPGVAAAVPRGRWQWPLDPRPAVLRRFSPPATTWGPGHRGVDLAAAPGASVRAVADGRVTHVGVIGGKPTISVLHSDGVRSTYEPVIASVRTDELVTAGQRIGTVAAAGSHCAGTCIHLGAVRGSEYLDPLAFLRAWRVRLLPLRGLPADAAAWAR